MSYCEKSCFYLRHCQLAFVQDLVIQQGLLPIAIFSAISAHEGAGVSRAMGSGVTNESLQFGDNVMLSLCILCGDCK